LSRKKQSPGRPGLAEVVTVIDRESRPFDGMVPEDR
jgi:hypothetical protein